MLTTLRKRLRKDDEGFTLIELMVVVLIIAILIAIAIPTFLGAQDRARDRGAQSNLRNAITAAKTIAVDNSGLFLSAPGAAITAGAMYAAEPSLTFSGAAVSTEGPIYVAAATNGTTILLYNKSASGGYFCIAASSTGAVTYGSKATAPAAGDCVSTKF